MDLNAWQPLCQDDVHYEEPIDHEAFFHRIVYIWRNQVHTVNTRISASKLIPIEEKEYQEVIEQLPAEVVGIIQRGQAPYEIRKLIPKEKPYTPRSLFFYEVSFEDASSENEFLAFFYPQQLDRGAGTLNPMVHFPYAIGIKILDEKSLNFVLGVPTGVSLPETQWMREVAYPNLLRWIRKLDPTREIKPTNRLVNVETYFRRYNRLKAEHGIELVKNWMEKTNPQKFVFEDCGIVSYLMETWERTGSKPKYIADLGCGNGLLVHLLEKEGIAGVGLDIKERKLWKGQLAGTNLKEMPVDPTLNPPALPKEVDYLIGNHSDELTPWIPVMAARLRCEFFLLPCCPFDFHGKFIRRPGKKTSVYGGFLEFTKSVCRSLGYEIEEDRMSIPSSKRLCIIGRIPAGGLPPPEVIEKTILELTADGNGKPHVTFVARPRIQPVRNCTNIPRDLAQMIAVRILKALLDADTEANIDGWHIGGAVPMSEMIKLLAPEEKAYMKQQDGGFQTFLKNQHQAFHIYEGAVHVRHFDRVKDKRKIPATQTCSPCWMQKNHPDGCPYGESCKFLHSEA